MKTFFAPAQKTERRKFKNQIAAVSTSPIMNTLLETAAGILIVLNEDRQIVALNHKFLENLGIENSEEALGLRLGESLSCIHACKNPAGCGTTEFCSSCGAAIAMMAAINQNRSDERICAMVSNKDGKNSDICLRIKAKPIRVEGQRWILIYARDITREQFWANLDHVFFHDINNTLTSLYGHIQMFELDFPENQNLLSVRSSIERLIKEVFVQKKISQHKDISYTPVQRAITLNELKKEMEIFIKGHKAIEGKEIRENWGDEDIVLKTDVLLLSRILGNMLINALEATPKGGFIRITADPSQESVTFTVWNQAAIPENLQKRIFQRHFSSKPGSGRGFGTYSMKLFGENLFKQQGMVYLITGTGNKFSYQTCPLTSYDFIFK